MTLQQLQSVEEVARAGSISGAARRLFLSQSRLSESVRSLEEELGVCLFERTNRGIVTTPDGEEFLTCIRPVLEGYRMIQEKYRQTAKWR
ncbi:MAG: LysR family transcriptional regulator [Bacillota bacterium]|nr:LysR family transcriptional regulator [Bacillota bacterium]